MRTVKSFVLALVIVTSLTVVSFAQSASVVTGDRNAVFASTQKYVIAYPHEANGHVYGKNTLQEMLQGPGVQKVFVFNGLEGQRNIKLIFKGADKNGVVLATEPPYDDGVSCPPFCVGGDDSIASIGSAIDEGLAQQWIMNFQNTYRGRAKAQIFDKESIEQLLAQEELAGVYFVNAMNERGEQTMVLVGLDANANIMWDGVVIDDGTPVPAFHTLNYPSRDIVAKK